MRAVAYPELDGGMHMNPHTTSGRGDARQEGVTSMNEKLWSLLRAGGGRRGDSTYRSDAVAMRGGIGSLAALTVLAVLCAYFALALVGGASASAAPTAPSLFDEITESEVPLTFATARDMAVDTKSGDYYVTLENAVTKLSPYGAFILAFGKEVDSTKVALRKQQQAKSETVTVTAQEENLCTAASGDSCSTGGAAGKGAGELSSASGVAVEAASGDVFVVDGFDQRVEKFDPSGHFLLAFGKDVNKVKTAALAPSPSPAEQAAANLCAAGEECQAGVAGTAEGAFEGLGTPPGEGSRPAQTIAVGGPAGQEQVYVGDKARIEVFNHAGQFVEQLSLNSISSTAKVVTIAADVSGNVFFGCESVAGVHMADTNGSGKLELTANVFDTSSTGVESLGVGDGNLYVADSSPSLRILDYEVANPGQAPAEFATGELAFKLEVELSTIHSFEAHGVAGIAVNGAGTVATAIRAPLRYLGPHIHNWSTGYQSGIDLYGSLSGMEGSYGAPPLVKPAIESETAKAGVEASAATLEAKINPELRATKYQLEYGQNACGGGGCAKTPVALASLGTTVKAGHQVLAALGGLEVGLTYHYRVVAENSAGSTVSAEHVFTVGASQAAGPAVGLPDGRVYEEVSPADKYGYSVESRFARPAFVAPDGQSVMYEGSGALAEDSTNSASFPLFVSQRTAKGWVTRSTMPLPVPGAKETEEYVTIENKPEWVVPSADLSRLLFSTGKNAPYVGAPDENKLLNNFYLEGPDPLAEPEWIGRSQITGKPGGAEATIEASKANEIQIAGTSPDLGIIYFFYNSKLFPEASKLYEYRDGVLSDAGVLPNGEASSAPATPAAQTDISQQGLSNDSASPTSAAGFNNQVSADGSRIFFVRADHAGTLELYVHTTASDGTQSTELVSRSLLAGHEGEPSPHGPYAMPSTAPEAEEGEWPEHGPTESAPAYVFASPDGSHAFFRSTDRLTQDAPESGAAKTYDFDLETGGLEYLAAITGSIAVVSKDGSSLLFENTAVRPFTLERWVAGPGGGTVTDVAELPPVGLNGCGNVLCVGPAYVSTNGSVITFATEAPIPGFNDGGTHIQSYKEFGNEKPEPNEGAWPDSEVFRYEASAGDLDCVSCPPKGQAPTGNAILSKVAFEDNATSSNPTYETNKNSYVTSAPGGVNAVGSEVFFETPNALVPQDTNGVGDVYEWEDGKVSLISGGKDANRSVLLGVSESGDDAFFATAEGIVAGDTDGAYDVYDARVPQPGDKPVGAIPCEGAVCQGPPSTPQLLASPASETFNGLGNPTPEPAVSSKPKPKVTAKAPPSRAQRLRNGLAACKRKYAHNKHKLNACMRSVRSKFGPKPAKHARKAHRNGRGK